MNSADREWRPEKVAYRVYSRRDDVETDWAGLGRVLGASASRSDTLAKAWRVLDDQLLPWRIALLLAASEAAARIRQSASTEALAATSITLLLDQSGSMRGQKMLYAAATLDVAQEFLAGLGVRVEVLGFTTLAWRGGSARWWWQALGAKRMPGRLNNLLHIIYRDAGDARVSSAPHTFREMLRPELPKENIDGEALEWAAGRLRAQSGNRKILLILSDGAPVDDATLEANHDYYLEDHLLDVIADLTASSEIELHAMGIGFDVARYYPGTPCVAGPEDLGHALLEQLECLLIHPAARSDSDAV
jgi:cobaltochelatase CobT